MGAEQCKLFPADSGQFGQNHDIFHLTIHRMARQCLETSLLMVTKTLGQPINPINFGSRRGCNLLAGNEVFGYDCLGISAQTAGVF